MTITGAGGVVIKLISISSRYKKQYQKLPPDIQSKIKDILKGYHKPNIYTVHITGNFKMSFEITGNEAKLRCVGNHNEIDRRP